MHVVYCSSFIDANVAIVFILYAFLVCGKSQQMQCMLDLLLPVFLFGF